MKSVKIKKANGTGETIYHRLQTGNDIVSTTENHNAYWGSINTAPDGVDFVIDGSNYYYKTYDRNNNIVWQKIYLRGGTNG